MPSPGEPAPQVAVLGLGQMGSALARAFVDADIPTVVWNRSAGRAAALVAAGAVEAPSVERAVDDVDLVVVCVSDYSATRELLHVSKSPECLSGTTVVQLSSGTPEDGRHLRDAVAAAGSRYLDGAIMSYPSGIGRDALILVSGDEDEFSRRAALLGVLGAPLFVGADPGAASAFDTSLLVVAWATLIGFFHGTALVHADGVEPSRFADIAVTFLGRTLDDAIRSSAGMIGERRYPGSESTLVVHHAAMEHAIESSRSRGLAADVPVHIAKLAQRAIAAGHGDDDLTAIFEVVTASS